MRCRPKVKGTKAMTAPVALDGEQFVIVHCYLLLFLFFCFFELIDQGTVNGGGQKANEKNYMQEEE